MFDAGGSEPDVVPSVRFFHSGVVRHTQSELVGLLQHGFHHVAINSQDLDTIRAHRLQLPHSGVRLFGVGGRRTAAKHWINKDARRDYFPFRALSAKLQSLLSVAADVTDGRNTARHPSLEFVVERLRNVAALILYMRVSVDQAGHDVLARGVDLDIAGRPPPRPSRDRDWIECNDARDASVVQHNILWTRGRRTVALNDGGITDHNSWIAMAAHDLGVGNLRREIQRTAKNR